MLDCATFQYVLADCLLVLLWALLLPSLSDVHKSIARTALRDLPEQAEKNTEGSVDNPGQDREDF